MRLSTLWANPKRVKRASQRDLIALWKHSCNKRQVKAKGESYCDLRLTGEVGEAVGARVGEGRWRQSNTVFFKKKQAVGTKVPTPQAKNWFDSSLKCLLLILKTLHSVHALLQRM